MPLLAALAMLALAACSASDAAPGSGSPPPGVNPPFAPPRAQLATPPAGWVPMPQLATAATGAIGGSTADAWGEPAMGCYAAIVTFSAKGKAGGIAKALRTQVESAVKVSDVVEPAATAETGVLAFAFEKAPYRGRARVSIDAGVTALACFWNDREPDACAAACTALIGGMK